MAALCCGVMLACAVSVNDDRLATIRVETARCLNGKFIVEGIPLQAVCEKFLIDVTESFPS
jgi:hypothetical protein